MRIIVTFLVLFFITPGSIAQRILIDTTKVSKQPQVKFDQSGKILQIPWNISEVEKFVLQTYVDTHFIFLSWMPVNKAKGYNLYRRVANQSYKKINKQLIVWPTDKTKTIATYQKILPHPKFKLERIHIQRATIPKGKEIYYPPFTDPKLEPVLRYLGKIYYQVALIIGQGFADNTVTAGTTYTYKITWVDQGNKEIEFGGEVSVTAGKIKKLSKPTGVKAEAGDSEILLLWNDPPAVDTLAGYHVYKSTSATGPFTRCDSVPILTRVPVDLRGDSLKPAPFGFLDPEVKNYTTYYYRIASRNPLGRVGPMSNIVSVMPRDLTPPELVKNMDITPLKTNQLLITWNWVSKDVKKRVEVVKQYHIFKYSDYQLALADTAATSQAAIGVVTEPSIRLISDTVRSYTDTNVIPEQVYWYRISCEDTAGNIGHKSAALSGILPDYEPPDSAVMSAAEGFDNYIQVSWNPPDLTIKKNQDLTGYLLYRGICGGYNEIIKRDEGDVYIYHAYPLHLLADITDKDTTTYKDYSLPKGSPICYRYALKCYDKAQNLSVMSDSLCERLRDKTPPDPPVITALQARSKSLKIECIAPPVQDMKGFIIERSENKMGPYKIVYSDSIPPRAKCGDFPALVDSVLALKVNQLVYVDPNLVPDKIYWYRAKAFDYDGNKSASSPPVSSYTYEINKLSKPGPLKADLIKQRDGNCFVKLSWKKLNSIDENFMGYVVYRSLNKKNGYRQLNQPTPIPEYKDTSVMQSMTYWYKVQAFDKGGDRSPVSDAVSVKILK